jgi:alpha-beta hydrolase superfamily lysophospholipase
MPRAEAIAFRAGDEGLAGTLLLPDGADHGARVPWAVLIASWLPRDRDGGWDRVAHPRWFAPEPGAERSRALLARLADALAVRGVASLRYDKRGCGGSGSRWEAADLFTLVDDARDALGAMRGRPELDLRRTGLVGHGEGAVVALSVAIADPAIGALTLVGSPARSWADVLRRGVARRERTGVDRQHPIVAALDRAAEELIERARRHEPRAILDIDGDRVTLELAGLEQAIHTPALALATMLHRSVTLVHGASDAWTDPDESRLLLAALPAEESAGLELVPGAGHDLREADADRIGLIADDLARRLVPRELPPVLLAIQDPAEG